MAHAVNAFGRLDRGAARASEARWRRDEALSPVDGVPAAVKDLLWTRGWPTQRGSLAVDPDYGLLLAALRVRPQGLLGAR